MDQRRPPRRAKGRRRPFPPGPGTADHFALYIETLRHCPDRTSGTQKPHPEHLSKDPP